MAVGGESVIPFGVISSEVLNSEVLPLELVAVAVMRFPSITASGTVAVNATNPPPLVVTVVEPRYT